MRTAPRGLALVDAILARGDLGDYHLAHSAHRDLCRRLGRTGRAPRLLRARTRLTRQEPERRFSDASARRIAGLSSSKDASRPCKQWGGPIFDDLSGGEMSIRGRLRTTM